MAMVRPFRAEPYLAADRENPRIRVRANLGDDPNHPGACSLQGSDAPLYRVELGRGHLQNVLWHIGHWRLLG